MPIIYQKFISREDAANNPRNIYVFGDNVVGEGYGGQARELRNAQNAIGIPTKHTPATNEEDYFTDAQIFDTPNSKPKLRIDNALNKILSFLARGRTVVIPSDGIGTGFAQLETRAPKTFLYIKSAIEGMAEQFNPKEDSSNG